MLLNLRKIITFMADVIYSIAWISFYHLKEKPNNINGLVNKVDNSLAYVYMHNLPFGQSRRPLIYCKETCFATSLTFPQFSLTPTPPLLHGKVGDCNSK